MNTKPQTPNGDECIIPDEQTAQIIVAQAKGVYQRTVAENLCEQGFVVGYLADGGALKGKAGMYKMRYAESVEHLMDRIYEVLPAGMMLQNGPTGQKGGFGYFLSTNFSGV